MEVGMKYTETELVTEQNFVPVVDGRGMFCGIVTRRDVITYLCEQVKQ